jgi:hypothetical protein
VGSAVSPNLQLLQVEGAVLAVVWVTDGTSSSSFCSDIMSNLLPVNAVYEFSMAAVYGNAVNGAKCLGVPASTGVTNHMQVHTVQYHLTNTLHI